jgi:hypothetical protein
MSLGWRLGRRAALLAAASALVAGCSGTPPGAFIIVQNQVPNSDCSIPAGLGQVYRGEGVLDVRLISQQKTGYELFPVMQNNFPAPTGGQTVDANRIALSGFNVDVEVPSDATGDIADLINGYRGDGAAPGDHQKVQFGTLTSGSVASGGGFTSSAVEVFPVALAIDVLNKHVLSPTDTFTVLASVRGLGKTLSSSVTSDSFTYPITLCDGCLMDDLGPCPVAASAGNQCYLGQDSSTGCCTQNGQLFCPAMVAAAMAATP